MAQILVKTEYNWADEIDFPGWEILDKEEFEADKKIVKEFFEKPGENGFEICVGTNEEIQFNCYDDVFGWIEKKEVSDADAEVIIRVIGQYSGKITISDPIERIKEKYN